MKKLTATAIIILSLALFVFYTYKITHKSFGSPFTKYSSLSYDETGTSILFEMLKRLNFKVSRLTEETIPQDINPKETIILCLSPSRGFSGESKESYIGFIKNGGKVLLTSSHTNALSKFYDTYIEPLTVLAVNEKDNIIQSEAIHGSHFPFLWDNPKLENKNWINCKWPKALTVYSNGYRDVMVFLEHGQGNIIISSEQHFISNETLINHPPLILLKWLLGTRKRVLVDEYHHWLRDRKGLSFLISKYHLHLLIGYLILLTLLYLWHIIPDFRTPIPLYAGENISDQPTLNGYASLLKKGTAKGELLDICLEEWLKAGKGRVAREVDKGTIERIIERKESSANDIESEIVKTYNEISEIIDES